MSNTLHQSGDVTIKEDGTTLIIDIYVPAMSSHGRPGGTSSRTLPAADFTLASCEEEAESYAKNVLFPWYEKNVENSEKELLEILTETVFERHNRDGEYYEVTEAVQNFIKAAIGDYSSVCVTLSAANKPDTHRGMEAIYG